MSSTFGIRTAALVVCLLGGVLPACKDFRASGNPGGVAGAGGGPAASAGNGGGAGSQGPGGTAAGNGGNGGNGGTSAPGGQPGGGATGSGGAMDAGSTDAGPDVVCGSPTDPRNCGTCGHDCTALPHVDGTAAGIECRSGACYVPPAACSTGYGHCSTRPDDGCEASLTGADNCGACGVTCGAGSSVCSPGSGGLKCATGCAAPAPDLCVASCVDLKTDPRNCGTCGHDCTTLQNVNPNAAGITCSAGLCVVPATACTAGYGHCSSRADDGCETQLTTQANCGQCGKACVSPTGLCSMTAGAASCSSSCAAPSPNLCGSKCVDLSSDPSNCGACNHDCTTLPNLKPGAPGVECRSGACYVPPSACASGYGHCSTKPDDGCEATLSSPSHCGSCGLVCSGATPLCSLQSQPASCLPSCSGASPDLCGTACVNKMTDPKNCGSCGHDCGALKNVKPGATAPAVQCSAGACVIQPAACVAGTGHCTSKADDGCETDLTQPSSCGSCTNMCVAPTALCAATGGVPACSSSCVSPTPDLCQTKCVNTKTDPTNCGSCGHDCTALPHLKANAAVQCSASGGCVVPSSQCATGYANCAPPANDTDGCETPTNTNTNCGGCGVTCSVANGTASCSTGSCTLTACNNGFYNCNGTCIANSAQCGGTCGAPSYVACGSTCIPNTACCPIAASAMHYVDPSAGSDDPNHGSAFGACAYKTITYALSQATGAIALQPVVYSAPAETFPLIVQSGQQLLCKVGGTTAATIKGNVASSLIVNMEGSNSTAALLSDCIIDGTGNAESCVYGSGSAKIVNATIQNCGQWGVDTLTTVVLQGSTITHTGSGGVRLAFSALLTSNTFSNNPTDIVCTDNMEFVMGTGNKDPATASKAPTCSTCAMCPFGP